MSNKPANKKPIKSAKEAAIRSSKLLSHWSKETRLSQQILIYCAELLERISSNTQRQKKRPRTEWQAFLSRHMKAGVSIKDVSKKWQERKGTVSN